MKIISFSEFIKSSSSIQKTLYGKILYETFDSFIIPTRQYHSNGTDLYDINIKDKKYRIYIEPVKLMGFRAADVGFQRKTGTDWTFEGITNDLTASDVLSLFSTLIKIIKKYRLNIILISTKNEPDKANMYFRLANRVRENYKVFQGDDNEISLLDEKAYKTIFNNMSNESDNSKNINEYVFKDTSPKVTLSTIKQIINRLIIFRKP